MAFRENGLTRGFRPQKLTPRGPGTLLDHAGFGAAPVVLAPLAASGPDLAGDFDLAAIRPTHEQPALAAERSPLSVGWRWGAAVSAGFHLAALAALLTWATPIADPASPEPVTVDIVSEMPAPPVAAAPPPASETPPPPVAEPSPLPTAEPPPAPPVAAATPPASETPPPVAEPSPVPTAEPPPAPPVAAAVPPPAAETPPPPPVPEPSPLTSAKTPARPPVAKAPPLEPRPRPAPTANPAPRIAKPSPPAKVRTALPDEPRESATAVPKARRLASLPPETAAPAVSSGAAQEYRGEVLGRIAAQKRYPEAARERAPHGVAIVSFSIGGSGQLVGASLSQSAGDPLLDAEALATVRRASPFPPPPAGAPRNFSAPLSYRVR